MTRFAIDSRAAQLSSSKVEQPVPHPSDMPPLGADYPSIRQMTQNDSGLLEDFFNNMTRQSRFSRFMTPFSEVPPSLVRILSSVQPPFHTAFAATIGTGNEAKMIGEARYIATDASASTAEFAIAVADQWQGMGLARKLLQQIEDVALENGIGTLVGITMRSNIAMIELARRAGYSLKPDPSEARAVKLVKQLAVTHLIH
ncbi:MAG: GNAT family N-acetyltransferase [Rhizobiaceae bacterium]|nr:GNAT family N-acetyltransferase [Rhizobiaceae bacterium]